MNELITMYLKLRNKENFKQGVKISKIKPPR